MWLFAYELPTKLNNSILLVKLSSIFFFFHEIFRKSMGEIVDRKIVLPFL